MIIEPNQDNQPLLVSYWQWTIEKLDKNNYENAIKNTRAAVAAYNVRFGMLPERVYSGYGYVVCGPVPEGEVK